MHLSISRNADRTNVPWGSNFGLTTELYTNPKALAGDPTALRIGIASIEVDGCPFSFFRQALRTQMILSGASELNVDEQSHHLSGPGSQLTFSGESPTVCRVLERPLVVLNFIYGTTIDLQLCEPVGTSELLERYRSLKSTDLASVLECFIAIGGIVEIEFETQPVSLSPLDAVLIERQPRDCNQPVQVSGSGQIIVARARLGSS